MDTNKKTEKFLFFSKFPYALSFPIAFLILFHHLMQLPNMLGESGDAYSIWETILTFNSKTIKSSYVLYKGFLSVYPYVWLYNLAVFFHLDHFFFIKLYHAILFAYSAGIGLPHILTTLSGAQPKVYRNILIVLILYLIFKSTQALDTLMVDLPSWAFFIMSVSFALKIRHASASSLKILFVYCITGVLIGLISCFSGQYVLSALILILFVLCKLISEFTSQKRRKHYFLLAITALFFTGILLPRLYNTHFEETIVQPMRERGEWLPSAQDWLLSGLTRLLPSHKNFSLPPIPNNRGLAIIKKTEGDNFSDIHSAIQQGGHHYPIPKHLQLIRQYPFDFMMIWATRLFLALSFDNNAASIPHLFLSYSSLFFCFFLMFLKVKTFSQIFTPMSLIPLAFLATIAAPVLLQIELRFSLSIQSFIIGLTIMDDYTWARSGHLFTQLKHCIQTRSLHRSCMARIPYPLLAYILFILMSFMLYAALLETSGSDPDAILFKLSTRQAKTEITPYE